MYKLNRKARKEKKEKGVFLKGNPEQLKCSIKYVIMKIYSNLLIKCGNINEAKRRINPDTYNCFTILFDYNNSIKNLNS